MEKIVKVLISKRKIAKRIKAVAKEIKRDYEGKNPATICVLKGGYFVFTRILEHLDFPLTMDFTRLSSYGSGTTSSGDVKVSGKTEYDIKGRDVIVFDDIMDTGLSLEKMQEILKGQGANSVEFCILLKRKKTQHKITPKYTCFEIDDGFVVGCGLDYAERYRNLEEVCILSVE